MARRNKYIGGKSNVDDRNKKKVRREFLLKEPSKLGERKEKAYILSNFRNMMYNTMEVKGLTINELSIVMWAYPYTFFSREALIERCRIGIRGTQETISGLMEKGYIDVYAPDQMVLEDVVVKSRLEGMSDYIEQKKVRQPARYRLTRKGTQLCNMIIDEIDQGIVNAFEYETREAVESMKFIGVKQYNKKK